MGDGEDERPEVQPAQTSLRRPPSPSVRRLRYASSMRAGARIFSHFFTTGSKYSVLGGQHTIAALQAIKVQWEAASLDTDVEWLKNVVATVVLKHNTPLDEAQIYAGDHRQAQSDVHVLTLAGFLRLLLKTAPDSPLERRLTLTLQKSGWPRPPKTVCVRISSFKLHSFHPS